MLKQIFCLSILLLGIGPAYAQEISQQTALHIIVGEAANQGLEGMICVGEVLRHRGSTQGFYGYKTERDEAPSIWNMAAKAWAISKNTDYTKGADHFENVKRFGLPYWAKDCVITFQYKDHVFFKEHRFHPSH